MVKKEDAWSYKFKYLMPFATQQIQKIASQSPHLSYFPA